ncbi:MAG TPA: D-alanyl-D-alanine carboxypeptidase family protein, partial [Chloroflexota bacterium]
MLGGLGFIRRLFIAACMAFIVNTLVLAQAELNFAAPRPDGLLALVSHQKSDAQPLMAYMPTPLPIPTIRPAPHPLTAADTVLRFAPPPILARAAYLIDQETGAVLYAKNPTMRLPMASTTKITTAVLALEHGGLDHLVRVSRNAASIGESTMGLRQGERVTVFQLLYGLLLNSGNDAAIALAEHVAGSEGRFVAQMNALAQTLGMTNTHYVTPHGLDAPNHFTSARDLATVAAYAMRDPLFRRIVATTSYYVPPTRHNSAHWLASVNKVIYWYPGVDGVKPGNTDAAGLCQVVSVSRDGHHLLAVLLNTPNLVTDIRNLFDFGLHDFRWVQGPAWWDTPAYSITGGRGSNQWIYYVGAGHYIRGPFLHYFHTHGGLITLGYPRTEALRLGGQRVQFFQGGELVADPGRGSVYPVPLGVLEAQTYLPFLRPRAGRASVARGFATLYKRLGGPGVLGLPVTPATNALGYPAQFFEYGELAHLRGGPILVASGDVELRLRGWLPAQGVTDTYSSSMTPVLFPAIHRHVARH